jgi:hypothetical protein
VYDSFSESSVDPSGARSRPGLALAVATLAAAGLAGAVVGGLTWSYDHYSGSANAADPTGFGLDGDVQSTAPGTTSATASEAPGTPGWAETLVLPAVPSAGSTGPAGSTVSTGGGAGGSGAGGQITKVKPGPAPGRGGRAEGTLNPGGDDSPTVPEGPWPSESDGGDGASGAPGDDGSGAPGDDSDGGPGGNDGSEAPGDDGSGAPGDGGTSGAPGDGGTGGDTGESGAPGDGTGTAVDGASPTESATPSPSPSAPAARGGHARWFIFRG